MALVPLILLLLILPLAVAGQNIGTGVVGLMLLVLIWQRRTQLTWSTFWPQFKVPVLTAVFMLMTLAVSTSLNPVETGDSTVHFLGGYQIWLLLPVVIYFAYGELSPLNWDFLFRVLSFVSALLGLVALSQIVVGWRLEKVSFVVAELRARGFYSHPLTFAYVILIFFPLGVASLLKRPRSIFAWLLFSGTAAALFASDSRAAELVAIMIMVTQIFLLLKGRVRVAVLGLLVLIVAGVAVTPNRASERFKRTINGNFDVQSGYADDRLAFWDVHWLMFKERPLLGHGMNTNTAYRAPYYEAMGLGQMKKKYEAHNVYLQTAVDGGLVGLSFFLWWIGWHMRDAWHQRRQHWSADAIFWSWVALVVASLVQNSFQDSEVRYVLTLLVAAQWLSPWRQRKLLGEGAH